MAKPLRSDDPTPKDTQFSHFGVLNDGPRSKAATVTSITLNVLVALVIVILGAVAKTNPAVAKRITELTLPPKPPEVVPAPKPPPPPPPRPLPPTPKVQPPKIKLPEPEKVPDIKPVIVPTPKPIVAAPAPPKAVTPPPAPVKVNLASAAAAHVVNNDPHPTAVRLGQPDSPLKPLTGPAVSRVNLGGAGAPGMPASNTGNGPAAKTVSLGSGCANCTNLNGHDNGVRPVTGIKNSFGGNGPMNSKNLSGAPVQVQLQQAPPPAAATHPPVKTAVVSSPPKVTFKPTPVYTAEARSMHLEGAVSIRIRVTSGGAVQVLGVTRSLGHGLDQSAVQAIEGTRFQPAKDASGNSIDWEGVVNVNFQLG